MDTEAFIRWALDDARTVEERYTVELLVEQGVICWETKRLMPPSDSFEQRVARNRERTLNPAYEPEYSETRLRQAVEYLAVAKSWSFGGQRPVRDLAALSFMPALEDVSLFNCCAVTDITPLTKLPALRKLGLGYPESLLDNLVCRDFTPLARCTALRDLTLCFNVHWPDLGGIETLTQLEYLALAGNLLAMPRGASFPNVRRATLYCRPLSARSFADFPQVPACELLTLSGAERLDGIERMPRLRNLTLLGPFESFEPLTALKELTCLTVTPAKHDDPEKMPRDVAPLARLPKLHFLKMGSPLYCILDQPRDYSPLVEAPALRELIVQHCAPVEMEVAAIQLGLPPCDDLFLAPEPRPLLPLRMMIGPHDKHPVRRELEQRSPGETSELDAGLRDCEGRWVSAYLRNLISTKLGHQDWGEASADGTSRMLNFQIHSFESVAKFSLIIDITRHAIASLRDDYNSAGFMIYLKAPPPEETPAQKELVEKFRDEQDEWEFEQRQRDRKEYLDRLHRLELKKQEGTEITPEEFSPSEQAPYPEPPWAKADEDDDDEDGIDFNPDDDEDDDSEGGTATKEKPEPAGMYFDDQHPLASNYMLMGTLTLDEVWFFPHQRDLATQLMGREPDEEFPEEKKAE